MQFHKTSCSVTIAVLIGMFSITPLCSAGTSNGKASIKEVKQEAHDLIQALEAYSSEQRDEAIRKSKTALENLDKRIDALETRIDNNWDKMDKAARKKARASLQALHKQRTQVAEWYGSLKSGSADAWQHMKKGFSSAYKDLLDAWEKSEKEFGSGK